MLSNATVLVNELRSENYLRVQINLGLSYLFPGAIPLYLA